jgi:hypothetical protein
MELDGLSAARTLLQVRNAYQPRPPLRTARWAVWAAFCLLQLAFAVCLGAFWWSGRLAWWEAGGLYLLWAAAHAAYALDELLSRGRPPLLPPRGDAAA